MNLKSTTIDNESILIALQGELDTLAAEQFPKDLEQFIKDSVKNIVLDFSELEYISSAGMRIILFINKNAHAKGGKVSIKNMSEDIRQIFQMTGFDQMLEIL